MVEVNKINGDSHYKVIEDIRMKVQKRFKSSWTPLIDFQPISTWNSEVQFCIFCLWLRSSTMEFLKSYPTIHWNFVFTLHLFNDIVNHFRFFLLSFFSNSGWGFLAHHQGLSCDFERDCEKNSCNDTYSVVVFTGGCKLITEKVRCNIKMFFLISARYTSGYLNCFNCLLRLHSFVSYNRQEWKWISMDT